MGNSEKENKLSVLFHSIIKRFTDNRKIILFPIFAFVIYYCLKEAFWAYAGLVDPGGEAYSPFLSKYSLIQLILYCLIYPMKFILNIMGYQTFNTHNIIAIKGSGGVGIQFPCLGVEMMIALVALIIAYPIKRKKLLFIVLGILAIHLLNIARLLSIVFVSYYSPGKVNMFHNYFNDIAYIIAFLFFYVWLSYVSPKEEEEK